MQIAIPAPANDNPEPTGSSASLARFLVESCGYSSTVFAADALSAAGHFKKKAASMGIPSGSITVTRC